MPFNLIRQDITKMNTDAIVNAANTALLAGGGVCGAIFRAAGSKRLTKACEKLAPIQTGEAVVTPGFKLPAKYIIHTAGPIYSKDHKNLCHDQLKASYLNSLKLADSLGLSSIAFPLISSGIYGYPKQEAIEVAQEAVEEFLQDHDMDIYLTVFDRDSFEVSEKLMKEVEEYIDQNYADLYLESESSRTLYSFEEAIKDEAPMQAPALGSPSPAAMDHFDQLLDDLDLPFNKYLLQLIDKKGKKDSEVYKKANIDRKLFSKIRSDADYTPRKKTILSLALALELSLEETQDLLERAGYTLSHSKKFDVIIEYFIQSRQFNIFQINEVLFKYDLPTLGA